MKTEILLGTLLLGSVAYVSYKLGSKEEIIVKRKRRTNRSNADSSLAALTPRSEVVKMITSMEASRDALRKHKKKDVIYVSILTGALGSGKTTVLSRMLKLLGTDIRLGLIVNDFAKINVDFNDISRIADDNTKIFELSGGCICCSLQSGLKGAMESLLRERSDLEYILIESSGITDPVEAILVLQESMSQTVRLATVIHVVDADVACGMDRQKKDAFDFADIVLLNKADLVEESTMETIREEIKSNSGCEVVPSVYGRVPLEKLLMVKPVPMEREGSGRIVRVLENENAPHSSSVSYYIPEEGNETNRKNYSHYKPRGGEQAARELEHRAMTFSSPNPLSLFKLQQHVFQNKDVASNIVRLKGTIYFVEAPHICFSIQQSGNQRRSIDNIGPWKFQPGTSLAIVVKRSQDVDVLRQLFESCQDLNQTPQVSRSVDITNLSSWIDGNRNFEMQSKGDAPLLKFRFTGRKSYDFSEQELMSRFHIDLEEVNKTFATYFNMRSGPNLLLPINNGYLAMAPAIPETSMEPLLTQCARVTIDACFTGKIRVCRCD